MNSILIVNLCYLQVKNIMLAKINREENKELKLMRVSFTQNKIPKKSSLKNSWNNSFIGNVTHEKKSFNWGTIEERKTYERWKIKIIVCNLLLKLMYFDRLFETWNKLEQSVKGHFLILNWAFMIMSLKNQTDWLFKIKRRNNTFHLSKNNAEQTKSVLFIVRKLKSFSHPGIKKS